MKFGVSRGRGVEKLEYRAVEAEKLGYDDQRPSDIIKVLEKELEIGNPLWTDEASIQMTRFFTPFRSFALLIISSFRTESLGLYRGKDFGCVGFYSTEMKSLETQDWT